MLNAVQTDLFSREAVTYLTKRVNEFLRQRAQEQTALHHERASAQRAALADAEATLENIRRAIKAGIITPTTKQLLEEAEAHLQDLRVPQPSLPPSTSKPERVLSVLPAVVEGYLASLRKLLHKDLPKARTMLRLLIREVRLVPQHTGAAQPGLLAQVHGDIQGVFSLLQVRLVPGGGFRHWSIGL